MARVLPMMFLLAGLGSASLAVQAGEAGRAGGTSGAGGAKAEVIAAFERLGAVRSYRAVVEDRGAGTGTMRIEHVAPDRFRLAVDEGIQTIIGTDMYMQMEGRTHRLPAQPGMIDGVLGQWRHAARMTALPSTRVEARGRERIDGVDAARFHIANSEVGEGSASVWIADGYPVRIEMTGADGGVVSFRYSDINSTAIRIDPPR